jgi:uncharacterized damage-inducible protein DinB
MSVYGAAELAKSFRTVRNNTIQIAQEIPEESYGFRAAPGLKSVGEILTHIAVSPGLYEDMHRTKRVTTLAGYDFGGVMARGQAEEKKTRTKAEIVALLQTNGEAFASWLETLTPAFLAETFTDPMGQNPRTRLESLLSPKEHEMHHRGQLMIIQRMLGLTPHLTRQMEERMRARAQAPAPAGPAAG